MAQRVSVMAGASGIGSESAAFAASAAEVLRLLTPHPARDPHILRSVWNNVKARPHIPACAALNARAPLA